MSFFYTTPFNFEPVAPGPVPLFAPHTRPHAHPHAYSHPRGCRMPPFPHQAHGYTSDLIPEMDLNVIEDEQEDTTDLLVREAAIRAQLAAIQREKEQRERAARAARAHAHAHALALAQERERERVRVAAALEKERKEREKARRAQAQAAMLREMERQYHIRQALELQQQQQQRRREQEALARAAAQRERQDAIVAALARQRKQEVEARRRQQQQQQQQQAQKAQEEAQARACHARMNRCVHSSSSCPCDSARIGPCFGGRHSDTDDTSFCCRDLCAYSCPSYETTILPVTSPCPCAFDSLEPTSYPYTSYSTPCSTPSRCSPSPSHPCFRERPQQQPQAAFTHPLEAFFSMNPFMRALFESDDADEQAQPRRQPAAPQASQQEAKKEPKTTDTESQTKKPTASQSEPSRHSPQPAQDMNDVLDLFAKMLGFEPAAPDAQPTAESKKTATESSDKTKEDVKDVKGKGVDPAERPTKPVEAKSTNKPTVPAASAKPEAADSNNDQIGAEGWLTDLFKSLTDGLQGTSEGEQQTSRPTVQRFQFSIHPTTGIPTFKAVDEHQTEKTAEPAHDTAELKKEVGVLAPQPDVKDGNSSLATPPKDENNTKSEEREVTPTEPVVAKPEETETVQQTPVADSGNADVPTDDVPSSAADLAADKAAKEIESIQKEYRRHAARVRRLEKLEGLQSKLNKLTSQFTFPERLDFADASPATSEPNTPSLDPVDGASQDGDSSKLAVPPLAFTANNAPYHQHAQALLSLLVSADGISSDGDKQVRKVRKDFVKSVEARLADMEKQRRSVWEKQQEHENGQADRVTGLVTNGTEPEKTEANDEEPVAVATIADSNELEINMDAAKEPVGDTPVSASGSDHEPSAEQPKEESTVHDSALESTIGVNRPSEAEAEVQTPAPPAAVSPAAPKVDHESEGESDSDSSSHKEDDRFSDSSDDEADAEHRDAQLKEKRVGGKKEDVDEFIVI